MKKMITPRTQKVIDELVRQRKEVLKDYIKSILLGVEESRLNGKGYDFFFKLNTDLDKLNNF